VFGLLQVGGAITLDKKKKPLKQGLKKENNLTRV
jgi:hypothetical protein